MENCGEVVCESANDDGLVPQSARWGLCNDRIADGTNGDHVHQSRDDKQDADCQLSILAACPAKSANDDKNNKHEDQAGHVDGSSTKMGEQ